MTAKEIRRKVEWRDLRKLNFKEKIIENGITLPWLGASLYLAFKEEYLFAIPFSVVFFLTGLRQVHNGFHKALGTGKRATWFTLYLNSILMMVSIHAVEFNHLRHHKYELSEQDYEAKSARMSAIGAICYGLVHIFMILWVTLTKGNAYYRLNLFLELFSIGAVIFLVFHFEITWLIYHVIIMILGEFLSAFFAVWTVHHDTEDQPYLPRTQRTKWKNIITFNMFYHLEHHLFPAVPTVKLPELARRIDAAFPDLKIKSTF